MTPAHHRIIWWLRRDLRLSDNQALDAAQRDAGEVIPLYVLDPFFRQSRFYSTRRAAFLHGGLQAIDLDLQKRGGRLIVRSGDPVTVLQEVAAESGASVIYAEADYSPYARRRDQRVSALLPLQVFGGTCFRSPGTITKDDGTPYSVYSPFMRKWKALGLSDALAPLPAPDHISTPVAIRSEAQPAAGQATSSGFPPGEQEAQSRLQKFSEQHPDGIFDYHEQRNRLDLEGTSQLSPYLRFGMLSVRQAIAAVYWAMQAAGSSEDLRGGAESWLNELIWREFYISIMYHHPQVLKRSFKVSYDNILWQNDESDFDAWRKGKTGYPIVDAAMRQLTASGWMHNRGRMIVASFLVKNLLIDWRWGEQWFMHQLIDGDPAANNGGWQWTAGTGTDAAPYFRVFNPILQSRKFDPHGTYIRKWSPELAQVPDKYIHTPWKMPLEVQQASDCIMGEDYPLPIVDLQTSRQRALAAYAVVRKA